MGDLASVYYKQRRLEEAMMPIQRCVLILDVKLGKQHRFSQYYHRGLAAIERAYENSRKI